jgi:hypothetical protein
MKKEPRAEMKNRWKKEYATEICRSLSVKFYFETRPQKICHCEEINSEAF